MLMLVVSGLTNIGFLDDVAARLTGKVKNFRQLYLVLVLLCFFSSMFINNDVALITFVPFSIRTLKYCKQEKKLILVIVMETVAANLGSMFTPIGNPQNLFIYANYNMSLEQFVKIIFPYSLVSVFILVVLIFAGALLVVVFKLDYRIVTPIVIILLAIQNYRLLAKVDYSLLFTFVFFFIFIGNLGNITPIKDVLTTVVQGNEFALGVSVSQIFSNVPATMLLSGFTKNYAPLLLGVNVGGLGTLIASMASLISYKFYANEDNAQKLKYLAAFSIINILFMVILVVIYMIF